MLFDTGSGQLIRRIMPEPRPNGLTRIGFSPDNKMLLAKSPDGTIYFWDSTSGKQLRSFARSNENLSPAQVHRLHRFSQILQRNFINRRGVLKNELRRDPAYRAAKATLDFCMAPFEWAFYNAGSALLRMSMSKARRGHATIVLHKPRKPVFRAES